VFVTVAPAVGPTPLIVIPLCSVFVVACLDNVGNRKGVEDTRLVGPHRGEVRVIVWPVTLE
jgi:hypothetical protein